MVLHALTCKHFDILLIHNCLEVGPWTIFGPHKSSKFDVYLHIHILEKKLI